ncbi:MAG: radical SAM protein [Thermoprotei archaeon]|nr:MAG: radical SAM protein [Thermoprotei archaeon]
MNGLQESPDYIRLSTAADVTLGFTSGRFYRGAQLYCINLLLYYSEGCRANCLYCGQAREAAGESMCKTLIRVDWPLRELDDVIARMRRLIGGGCFMRPYRVCVASITNAKAIKGEIEVIKRLYNSLRLPISALISPTIFPKHRMEELKEAGAERIGIAIDCATPSIFDLLRGSKARGPHRWEVYLKGVHDAVEVLGEGKVGIHLIVGLGETEEEAVKLIQWAHDAGAETHLFSFYPEPGSILEGWRRPDIGQYRRVQLARYLIDLEYANIEDFEFNEYGQIVDFKVPPGLFNELVKSGRPFMTSGCPGCNRPYSNERPGEEIRNYPFMPSPLDVARIRKQLFSYKRPRNRLEDLIQYLEGLSSEKLKLHQAF